MCEYKDIMLLLLFNTYNIFYLLIHRARIKGNNSVKINDCVLKRVNKIKYFGVIKDYKLKWCEHMSYAKNKISNGVFDYCTLWSL